MKFSEKLNDYIEQLSCTGKDICNLSGIRALLFGYKIYSRLILPISL